MLNQDDHCGGVRRFGVQLVFAEPHREVLSWPSSGAGTCLRQLRRGPPDGGGTKEMSAGASALAGAFSLRTTR